MNNRQRLFVAPSVVLRRLTVGVVLFAAIGGVRQSQKEADAAVFATAQTGAALHGQEVIESLVHLDELSLRNWRLHLRDVADAASPTLYEITWQKIQTPYAANAREMVSLRQTTEIPSSLHKHYLTGARLMLQSWGRDWVAVHFDGRREANGEAMKLIASFNAPRTADEVLLAVCIAAAARPKIRLANDFHHALSYDRSFSGLMDLYGVGDRGVSFSSYPHAGSRKDALAALRGSKYAYSQWPRQVVAHVGYLPPAHSFMEAEDSNVVQTPVKETTGVPALMLRFHEWADKNCSVMLHVPAGASCVSLSNMIEARQRPPVTTTFEGELFVPVQPFRNVTVCFD